MKYLIEVSMFLALGCLGKAFSSESEAHGKTDTSNTSSLDTTNRHNIDSVGMMDSLLNDSVGMTSSSDDCLLQVFCLMSERCVNVDGNCTQSGISCPPGEVKIHLIGW